MTHSTRFTHLSLKEEDTKQSGSNKSKEKEGKKKFKGRKRGFEENIATPS